MSSESQQTGGSLTARAFWLMLARTLAFVFSFALPLLLVRQLDQTQFGLYKQVFLLVGTAMYVLPGGFHMSAFYFLPRERERQGAIVLNIVIFHAVITGLSAVLLFVWPRLIAIIFHSPELMPYASLVGLVILFWGTSASLEYIAIANEETTLATIFIIISQLTRTAFLLGAALFAGTIQALIWGALVQGIVQTLILIVYAHRRFRAFAVGFDWALLRQQMAYALPLGAAAIIVRFQLDVDNYYVSHWYDPAQYAIYAIGCFNIPLFSLLSDAVGSVMIPRVAVLQKAGARREIAVLTARMMRKLAAVALPSYAFLLIVAPEFITLLFTARYLPSWPIFVINLAQIPMGIILSAVDPVMRAYAEHRYFLLRLRALLFLLLLVLLWFGITRFGLVGAVSTVVFVTALERLIMAVKLKQILGLTRRDAGLFKDVGKITLASVAASALTVPARLLLHGTSPAVLLLACGTLFSLVFLVVVVMLRVPEPEEREVVRRQFARLSRTLRWETKGAAQ
jgi:O-antigen/teichoic acid export membrane protein